MTAYGAQEAGRDPHGGPHPVDPATVMGAVREDIRQTLRTAWIDPALDVAASSPSYFTAAWSAIRPNVGKSFLMLTRALRAGAVESIRTRLKVPDVRRQLAGQMSEEEFRRLEEATRAAHLISGKMQIVVHALYRAARRERVAGTGREESPVRRGIPEWQRWMSYQPIPEESRPILEDVAATMGATAPPSAFRLVARWPAAASALWRGVKPHVGSEGWTAASMRLRRIVLGGISSLPHPVELQWTALRARGFTEEERARLVEELASYDAGMAGNTLASAFAWLACGAPEIGVEG